MTNAVIGEFRHLLRVAGLVIAAFVLAGCGGGSNSAPQLNGTLSSNAPPPASAPPPTSTPTVSAAPPAVALSDVVANPGATTSVNVLLISRSEQIAGVQTDLSLPVGARLVARGDGRPDCSVNPDINKGATSFVFLPNFCADAACTGLRAIVWASDNSDPIPDASVLFVCNVQIDFAAAGTLMLKTSQVIMSDPVGHRIDGEGIDGAITVSGEPLPTPIPTPTSATGGPAVVLDQITARPGATVDLNATLLEKGASIATVQFDVGFAPEARISANSHGKPFCRVNPDIDKGATSFAFRPNACVGTECTTFRTVVLSTDSVDPIPDGAVLITCRVSIASDALGAYPLTISGVLMTDPTGAQVHATGVDGLITVSGAPVPTETPTPSPEPSAATTPTPVGTITHPSIVLSHVSGAAGSIVMFDATLALPTGEIIVAAQNDIRFPAGARIATRPDGKPDCQVNPDIHKDNTSFAFQPPSCAGADCIGMRTLIVSLGTAEETQRPIPNGAVLYTCRLNIAQTAEGTLPLAITGVVMSDPDGNRTPDAEGIDGLVTITPP